MSFVIVAIANDKSAADFPFTLANRQSVLGGYTMDDGTHVEDEAFFFDGSNQTERVLAVALAESNKQESILYVDDQGNGFLVYASSFGHFLMEPAAIGVPLGKWHEVSKAEAKAAPGWTKTRQGHWFICG